jgi:uncharacterized membrane protein YqgA involved in biofilm formation
MKSACEIYAAGAAAASVGPAAGAVPMLLSEGVCAQAAVAIPSTHATVMMKDFIAVDMFW